MIDDVTLAEVAWLSTEPLAGYDPLLIEGGNGGVFDFIGEHTRAIAQHPRQVHVYRERTVERRNSTADKVLTHDMLCAVLWTKVLASEQAHVEQQQLAAAVARLVERIRGTLNNHTHGDRFWSAGETGGVVTDSGIDVRMPDWRSVLSLADQPLGIGDAYVVEVRYPIVEFVEG